MAFEKYSVEAISKVRQILKLPLFIKYFSVNFCRKYVIFYNYHLKRIDL